MLGLIWSEAVEVYAVLDFVVGVLKAFAIVEHLECGFLERGFSFISEIMKQRDKFIIQHWKREKNGEKKIKRRKKIERVEFNSIFVNVIFVNNCIPLFLFSNIFMVNL